MSVVRAGRNEPCPCGSGKKYKHCHGAQAASAAPTLAPPADVPARQLMAAFEQLQAGRIDEARLACARLLRASPGHPDVLHLQAVVLLREGQNAQALEAVTQALAVSPPNYSMYNTRGLLLQALDQVDEAIASFRSAVALKSRDAANHCNLGVALVQAGKLDEAMASLERSLELEPRMAAAHCGIGSCLLKRGENLLAIAPLERALALDPRNVQAWIHLGNACMLLLRPQEAERHLRLALSLEPRNTHALDGLARLLWSSNRSEEAAECLRQAQSILPRVERQIRLALLLPYVYSSLGHLRECRARVERELEGLAATGQPLEKLSLSLLGAGVFNLAYHAVDDRPVMERLAALYLSLYPDLAARAPHLSEDRLAQPRLRIGFYSGHLHEHSVAFSFAALVETLSERAEFDVHLISHGGLYTESAQRMLAGFRGTKLQVVNDYLPARQAIAALKLDVLVYLDIGMEPLSYFLAFGRLARVQCVAGGHPVTTGIAAIDYYLSSALAESDDADRHYSEKLVRLPIGFFAYREPEVPARHKERAELGLPLQGHLYLCPMMLQKLHPEFDPALAAILQADPEGHVVLFQHSDYPWHEALAARLDRSIDPSLRSRLHFHPWVRDATDFLSVNAHASVILDPFHFGIGSTAIATFAVGTPLVTWPGEFLRGRVGLAYNRMLELPECIATDRDDYVRRAVQIASHPELRADLVRRIAANKHRLYNHRRMVEDLVAYFDRLASGLRAGPAVTQPSRSQVA